MALTKTQIAHVRNTFSEELGFKKPLVNPITADFTKFGGLQSAVVEVNGFYYLAEIEGNDIFVTVIDPEEVEQEEPQEEAETEEAPEEPEEAEEAEEQPLGVGSIE